MKELQSMPWVPYALAGILGFALGAAMFKPTITPEYQRGKTAGYNEGITDLKFQRDWYETGWHDHHVGAPKRSF